MASVTTASMSRSLTSWVDLLSSRTRKMVLRRAGQSLVTLWSTMSLMRTSTAELYSSRLLVNHSSSSFPQRILLTCQLQSVNCQIEWQRRLASPEIREARGTVRDIPPHAGSELGFLVAFLLKIMNKSGLCQTCASCDRLDGNRERFVKIAGSSFSYPLSTCLLFNPLKPTVAIWVQL